MTLDHLFFTGLNVLLAWSVYVALLTGSLSFAQGAFMAMGCYGAGVLTVKFGLPLLPATLLAAVGAAVIAAVIGYPALRLRGIYLILVTLGMTFCVRVLLENVDYVGGVSGFGGMVGADLQAVLMAVVIVGALLFWLSRSPLQRIFDAVREDDRVAAAMGIRVTQIRLLGFAAGAAIAAVAGSLYGHYMNFVRPENFDVLLSVYVVLYVVLGGVNNLWGPLLGATVMTLLPEYFRVLADWRPTVFGLAILILLLFRPEGLLSFRTRTSRAKKATAP
ncbi:branched-chain amino acid ABC transporter permease [Hydrogenophaga laconesensis]|uniref:Branched-chain amino acid transport system permease protein n=1 Tax=Hydrogenophaga laconesensis TaxID=1805971 RepID=A0ABU1VEZ2_9BURK|nr:branched-chain amino acid ABC transporter permease [Hydrogenophaga laconesensis]MDR7096027.1 branched-chain amino acid transport system permease protein [Hydrogenophaga laconesensis]